MKVRTDLVDSYQQWQAEGTRMAGSLGDLSQRAAVYHHLYEHSGGNFVFPLIAAHGALWARGYFEFGFRLGDCLAWQYAGLPQRRAARLRQLADFADAFRDVNRRVCADTYATYHFAREHGHEPFAASLVDPALLAAMNRVHTARRGGNELPTGERRELFEAFFLNEQATVVGPSITAAVDKFRWPLMRWLALKPRIRFAYFPSGRTIWFRNFAAREQRIKNGLFAFDLAAEVGFREVAARLQDYRIMPAEFFKNPRQHFSSLRATVLATS